ncbi:PH-like domain-containing protein [Curtobacterium sp. 22159]|uniref:PH-like domain-containing protein n=1 Tax=Curtobacterium sp. 22159 TaxID=3453882 RepID=UPI003F835D66
MSGDALRWLEGAVILALVVLLFVAMARTWRTRTRKQAEAVPPVGVPADLAPAAGSWDGFTVATTRADQPLERITAGGLGFRSRGGVTVHDTGLVLHQAGAPDRWIAADAVRGADRATWAIDRVVEPGGLVRLRWTATGAAGATDLDTYFRFPEGDAAALVALQGLSTKHNHPHTAGEGTN